MSGDAQDSALQRYLDEAMDAAERAAFEAQLAADPALAARAARLRANDAALRDAMAGADAAALAQRFGLTPPASSSPSATVVDFAAARADRAARQAQTPAPVQAGWARRNWRWAGGGAIAAALVLAVTTLSTGGSGLAGDAQFQTALNRNASGTSVELADGRAVTPVLSFAAGDGRYCREFAIAAERGVACRGDGAWQIEALVPGAAPDASGGIRTAAGEDAAPLDALYQRLAAGDPLNAVEEQRLIADRWQNNRQTVEGAAE